MPEDDVTAGGASALERFLSERTASASGSTTWATAGMSFEIAAYLDDRVPPDEYVTSVRAIVCVSDGVVVVENPDNRHFLPGGRVEPGESYGQTLEREVAEECGVAVLEARYLGFLHFRHTTPRPAGYTYPYPHMIQLIYAVRATGDVRAADPTGWEHTASLATGRDASGIEGMEVALPFLRAVFGDGA